ncbi:hypothetical protein SAMD00019534_076820, partial [Acytostelium subglobosum LB1]|uniref:hypothetical protein n=1 Tax=Acytostelium subglobosum LB1 TaxID=1410327 RepID=UPI00064504BC
MPTTTPPQRQQQHQHQQQDTTTAAATDLTLDQQQIPHQHNVYEESTMHISWDHLDQRKYYTYNLLFAGAIDSMMYPMDLLRTRLQVQGSSVVNQTYPHYSSTWNGFKSIFRHEGFRGYYKGFLASESGYLSAKLIYYGFYEQMKQYLNHNDFGSYSPFIAGGLAELSASALTVPFEVMTQKCQIQGHMGATLKAREIFRNTYQEAGIRGIYRGFGITVLKNVPYSACWWGSYELTKHYLLQLDIRQHLGLKPRQKQFLLLEKGDTLQLENEDALVHTIAALVAAVISTTAANPLDVIKTRLQTTTIYNFDSAGIGLSSGGRAGEAMATSTWQTLLNKSHFLRVGRDTITKEGWRALWKGLVPSLLVAAPYSIISLVAYEQAKKL